MESEANKLKKEEIIATQRKALWKRRRIPVACSMIGISRSKKRKKYSCLREKCECACCV